MNGSPIRLGIIGMGPANMASTMTMLQEEPDLRYTITAACARRPDVLEQAARQFNIPFWSTDYRDLVGRDDVDVVCVYSPDALHAESCIAALQNGKHVICTKPMVTRLEDARTLVDLVRETGAKFLVGQTMRFDRQFLDAKRRYDEGDLGSLIALESFYLHDMRPVYEFTPWRLHMPQDFMFGGCVHSIDVIRAFGGDIKRVHAIANKGGLTPDYPIQDNFFLNVEFTSGVIGRVSGLYGIVHPPTPMMHYGVYGTKGSLQGEYTDNEPGEIRVVLDENDRGGRGDDALRGGNRSQCVWAWRNGHPLHAPLPELPGQRRGAVARRAGRREVGGDGRGGMGVNTDGQRGRRVQRFLTSDQQFVYGIPVELYDAGKIVGAGDFTMLHPDHCRK